MRSLHEITQLWLCRVLFLVAGVVPMLAVLAWAGVVQTAWHKSTYQRRAADILDADVTFSEIAFPRPGVTRIRGFKLHDSQTDAILAEIATLELAEGTSGWTIVGDDVRVNRHSLGELSQWFARALSRRPNVAINKVRVTLDRVHFDDASNISCHVVTDWTQTEHGTRLNASFVSAGESSSRVAMSAAHDRRDGRGNLRLVVDAEQVALPCSWIASVASKVGDNCTFQGKLWARLPAGSSDWYIDALAGSFSGLDLARLVAPFGESMLQGSASAKIRGALFEDGRLLKVAGSVTSEGGSIHTDLVTRLARELQLASTFDTQRIERDVQFDTLAFAFALDPDGLMIEGRVRDSSHVLIAGQDTLTSRPKCDAVPLAGVLRAIAGPDAPLVPANSATPWIVDLMSPTPSTKRR